MGDSRDENQEPDEHQEPADIPLTGEQEPPPVGPWSAFNLYSSPVPFGGPPSETVEIEGDVPWELREESTGDGDRSRAGDAAGADKDGTAR